MGESIQQARARVLEDHVKKVEMPIVDVSRVDFIWHSHNYLKAVGPTSRALFRL